MNDSNKLIALTIGSSNSLNIPTLRFFGKNTLYKNTEVRFAKKIRTGLENAQSQMRKEKNHKLDSTI